jgi:hypothetical protein
MQPLVAYTIEWLRRGRRRASARSVTPFLHYFSIVSSVYYPVSAAGTLVMCAFRPDGLRRLPPPKKLRPAIGRQLQPAIRPRLSLIVAPEHVVLGYGPRSALIVQCRCQRRKCPQGHQHRTHSRKQAFRRSASSMTFLVFSGSLNASQISILREGHASSSYLQSVTGNYWR